MTALVAPSERFTVASYRLAPPPTPLNGCGPRGAVDAIPPTGALAFVLEYPRAQHRRFPNRPAHFSIPSGKPASFECFGRGWLTRFRKRGRDFQLMIALGSRARATRETLLRTLDTLRVDAGAGEG